MRVLFCEKTSDISLFLSEKEIKELKRSKDSTPVLSASSNSLEFILINSNNRNYIRIHEPRDVRVFHNYSVIINDSAYEDLVSYGHCGTRYGVSSKVHVMRELE